jgi:hypothetical protein
MAQIEDMRQQKHKMKKYKELWYRIKKRPPQIHRIRIPSQLSEAAGRQVVVDPSLTDDGEYYRMSSTSSHVIVGSGAEAARHYFVLDELAPPDLEIRALLAKTNDISAEIWFMGAVVYNFVEKQRIRDWIYEESVEDKKRGEKTPSTELCDSVFDFYVAVLTIWDADHRLLRACFSQLYKDGDDTDWRIVIFSVSPIFQLRYRT